MWLDDLEKVIVLKLDYFLMYCFIFEEDMKLWVKFL